MSTSRYAIGFRLLFIGFLTIVGLAMVGLEGGVWTLGASIGVYVLMDVVAAATGQRKS